MARTRIKICGITRAEDAVMAAELGADAIGLNFVGGPRMIDVAAARQIVRMLPPLVTPVALLIERDAEHQDAPSFQDIREGGAIHGYTPLGISTFQLYGKHAIADDLRERITCWRVCHVAADRDLTEQIWNALQGAFGGAVFFPQVLLLDTAVKGQLGGSGVTFDWRRLVESQGILAQHMQLPRFGLAGGLNAANVGEAIRIARPYAVDVSSGVEVAGKPGIKDAAKMRDFIQAVRAADDALGS